MKVLIIDDDLTIANLIKHRLNDNNIDVDMAFDGSIGIEKLIDNNYQLILLDMIMPNMNGHEFLTEYNKLNIQTPVIVMSALSDNKTIIDAYQYNIIDYITKPFLIDVLLPKILNNLKILYNNNDNYQLLEEENSFLIDGNKIKFTKSEFDVFSYLYLNKGQICNKYDMIDRIWQGSEANDRVLDYTIKKIRTKLKNNRNLITTHRGIGYKYEIDNQN